MALVSCLPVSRYAAAWRASSGGCMRLLALLPVLAALFAPATAQADIYSWTDEQGRLVISDVRPVDPGKVSDMKLLAVTTKQAAQAPAAGSESATGRKQRELEARIEQLERELQEQQSAPQPEADSQAGDTADHYPAPPSPPPPPEPSYFSSDGPANYPVYYPNFYALPPPSYTVIVVPAKPVVRRPRSRPRPGFVPRPAIVSRPVAASGPVFVSRTPQFAGRTPQFAGRTPQFVARPPMFVSRPPVLPNPPAAGTARPARSGGAQRARTPAYRR